MWDRSSFTLPPFTMNGRGNQYLFMIHETRHVKKCNFTDCVESLRFSENTGGALVTCDCHTAVADSSVCTISSSPAPVNHDFK